MDHFCYNLYVPLSHFFPPQDSGISLSHSSLRPIFFQGWKERQQQNTTCQKQQKMLERQEGKACGLHKAKDRNEDEKTQVARRVFIKSATKGRMKQGNLKPRDGNCDGIMSSRVRILLAERL